MPIPQRKGEPLMFKDDEGIRPDTTVETLARLRPAFRPDGTITAGSASQISDGAAAVVVMSRAKAEELGLTWLAEIGAHGVVAGPDSTLQHQPAMAIRRACAKEGIEVADLDLVEINEAFAAVGLASVKELGIDLEMTNVNGGAIALGHPIGMSGARLVLHLALELARRGGGIGAAGPVRRRRPGRRASRAGPRALTSQRPAPHGGVRQSEPVTPTCPHCCARPARARRARSHASSRSSRTRRRRCARSPPRSLRTWAARGSSGSPGRPGVGKSTTTAALVRAFRGRGQRVGVLAVDPSSPFTGGALLGDRVRMQDHALDPGVFIRSMATRGHLGGLAWATPQAVRVLDGAGFDVVLVETVGVGQSEVEVAALADVTVVLLAPGMGDGVQAAKAGILEVGDVFVVNKADRDGAQSTSARSAPDDLLRHAGRAPGPGRPRALEATRPHHRRLDGRGCGRSRGRPRRARAVGGGQRRAAAGAGCAGPGGRSR